MKNIKLTEEECIKVLKHICNMLNVHCVADDIRQFHLKTSPLYLIYLDSIYLGHTPFWEPGCTSAREYFYCTIKQYLPTSAFLQTIIGHKSIEELLVESDLSL